MLDSLGLWGKQMNIMPEPFLPQPRGSRDLGTRLLCIKPLSTHTDNLFRESNK